MCHGFDAKGNGPVLATITNDYGYEPIVPTDFTNRPVAFIASRLEATSRPLGPTSVMPPFGKLLSQAERVAIAEFVGSLPKKPFPANMLWSALGLRFWLQLKYEAY